MEFLCSHHQMSERNKSENRGWWGDCLHFYICMRPRVNYFLLVYSLSSVLWLQLKRYVPQLAIPFEWFFLHIIVMCSLVLLCLCGFLLCLLRILLLDFYLCEEGKFLMVIFGKFWTKLPQGIKLSALCAEAMRIFHHQKLVYRVKLNILKISPLLNF